MPSVLDVADYLLKQHGPMTAMKLQKLVYYSQAWSIVWDDEAIFEEEIEAWKDGPVVRRLWDAHRGQYRVESIAGGEADRLSPKQKESVDAVLKFYGDKSAQWLSDLTHLESPWKTAWNVGQSSVISKAALGEYYSSIKSSGEQKG